MKAIETVYLDEIEIEIEKIRNLIKIILIIIINLP